MVWLLPLSESNRLHTVVVMTYVVALGGFSHIVAGSVDVSYGAFRGLYSWSEFPRFLLPTLAGNMLGGLALVTALNCRQVVTGNDGAEPSSHLRRAG